MLSATLSSDGTLEMLRAVVDLQSCKAKVIVIDLAEGQTDSLPEWDASLADCMLDEQTVTALANTTKAVHRIQSRVWARAPAQAKN